MAFIEGLGASALRIPEKAKAPAASNASTSLRVRRRAARSVHVAPCRASVNVSSPVKDIDSTDAFIEALNDGQYRLVVIKFYSKSCRACKAIQRKFEREAEKHPQFDFYQIDYDANMEMCWRLMVTNLPHIHCYNGAEGRVENWSIGPSTFAKLSVALAKYENAT